MESASTKIHGGLEGDRSPITSTETAKRCSSPIRPVGPDSIPNPPQLSESPVKPREVPKSTNVYVKVEWPSNGGERKLSNDLELLGKMLA